MSDRFVLSRSLGRWQTNCYVIGERDRSKAVVVDPGESGAVQVPLMLEQAEVTCEAILLTHGHLDHLWSVGELVERWDVPVFLHPADRWLWDDPAAAFGADLGMLGSELGFDWRPPTDHLQELSHGQVLRFGGLAFGVDHNPGHTPGHVTFLTDGCAGADLRRSSEAIRTIEADVLLSGDLIFAGSIGRTDLAGGSLPEIFRSLVDTVLKLADDTLILPGHGPVTSVGRERTHNHYLAQAAAQHHR